MLKKTKLRDLTYKPHFMAISPFYQFVVYLIYEKFCQIFFPPKFVREEFDLEDGGVMAIDWAIEKDGTGYPVTGNDGNLTKPILLLISGLGGGNDNLYTLNLMYKAQSQGFKCGTVINRGCAGLKIKSPRLSCAATYQDALEAIVYINKKYIIDKKTGSKKQKLFAYGVSQGAF